MAIFRVEKTRNYTVMSNYHLKDKSISLKSKGLLAMMLSLPNEWNFSTRGLSAICKEVGNSIGSALRELEGARYIIRRRLRDDKGKITDTEYIIYEQPRCLWRCVAKRARTGREVVGFGLYNNAGQHPGGKACGN